MSSHKGNGKQGDLVQSFSSSSPASSSSKLKSNLHKKTNQTSISKSGVKKHLNDKIQHSLNNPSFNNLEFNSLVEERSNKITPA